MEQKKKKNKKPAKYKKSAKHKNRKSGEQCCYNNITIINIPSGKQKSDKPKKSATDANESGSGTTIVHDPIYAAFKKLCDGVADNLRALGDEPCEENMESYIAQSKNLMLLFNKWNEHQGLDSEGTDSTSDGDLVTMESPRAGGKTGK